MNKKFYALALGLAVILGGLSIALFASPSPTAAAGAPTIDFVGGVGTYRNWSGLTSGSPFYQIPGFNFDFPNDDDTYLADTIIIDGTNFTCNGSNGDTVDTLKIDGVPVSTGIQSCSYGTQITIYNLAIATWTDPSLHTITVTKRGGYRNLRVQDHRQRSKF